MEILFMSEKEIDRLLIIEKVASKQMKTKDAVVMRNITDRHITYKKNTKKMRPLHNNTITI